MNDTVLPTPLPPVMNAAAVVWVGQTYSDERAHIHRRVEMEELVIGAILLNLCSTDRYGDDTREVCVVWTGEVGGG